MSPDLTSVNFFGPSRYNSIVFGYFFTRGLFWSFELFHYFHMLKHKTVSDNQSFVEKVSRECSSHMHTKTLPSDGITWDIRGELRWRVSQSKKMEIICCFLLVSLVSSKLYHPKLISALYLHLSGLKDSAAFFSLHAPSSSVWWFFYLLWILEDYD